MEMDLDLDALREDLKSLKERRFETNRQLRELSGRGRGRGRGRGFGSRFGGSGPPYSGGRGHASGFGGPGGGAGGGRGGMYDQPQYPPPEGPEESSGRIKSTVVLRGRERLGRSDFIPPVLTKRPASTNLDKDQNLKKRNRRMFGALLGTLQQFCEEDQKFKESSAAQKREDALHRAEERQQKESMALRQKAREELREKRHQELCKLWDIDLETNLKTLELIYANKINRHKLLMNFIKTSTGPALHWLPGKHDEKTREMLLNEGRKYDKWKDEQLAELADEKEKLKQADEEKRKLRQQQQEQRLAAANGNPGAGAEEVADPNAQEDASRPSIRSVVQAVEPGSSEQQDVKQEEEGEEKEEEPATKKARLKRDGDEDGELPFDAKLHAAEQERLEEEIAAEEMAQTDDLIDDIA